MVCDLVVALRPDLSGKNSIGVAFQPADFLLDFTPRPAPPPPPSPEVLQKTKIDRMTRALTDWISGSNAVFREKGKQRG